MGSKHVACRSLHVNIGCAPQPRCQHLLSALSPRDLQRLGAMSFFNYIIDLLTRLVIFILASGPVPQHVAFVMDGNRRYARHKQMEVAGGHLDGFGALKRMLEICLKLNIKCVTVYAFSIENFKRPVKEVDTLMTLAKEKLEELCSHGDLLDQYQVRLNVLGKTELLPPDVLEVVHRAEAMTAKHNSAILNICMPYTSREEITSAVESIVRSHQAGEIELDDITPETLEARLYTKLRDSPKLDILVRTSGVHRLSDFLLWQACADTQIHFSDVYWPDFALRDLVPVLLDYQRKQWGF